MPRGGGFTDKYAWWYLGRKQKETLQAMRMGGQYGGKPPRAKYGFMQNAGAAGSLHGVDVGIEPTNFIGRALEVIDSLIGGKVMEHLGRS